MMLLPCPVMCVPHRLGSFSPSPETRALSVAAPPLHLLLFCINPFFFLTILTSGAGCFFKNKKPGARVVGKRSLLGADVSYGGSQACVTACIPEPPWCYKPVSILKLDLFSQFLFLTLQKPSHKCSSQEGGGGGGGLADLVVFSPPALQQAPFSKRAVGKEDEALGCTRR